MAALAGSALVERYLHHLAGVRACSPHTIAAYAGDLAILVGLAAAVDESRACPAPAGEESQQASARSAAPAAEPDWSLLDQHCLRRWLAGAARSGLAARTMARRLSAWRGFFDWLATAGVVSANPARDLRAPRAPRRLPGALSPELATRLVQPRVADASSAVGGHQNAPLIGSLGRHRRRREELAQFAVVRDDAMAELFYSSGLRLSELVSLDVQHFPAPPPSQAWIDLSEAEAIVRGKGGHRRAVPIGRAARNALERWLVERTHWCRRHADADERALFLAASGARISNRAVQLRLKQRAIERGIPANVHPHVLRHSFASHLLQSSGDLRAVQDLLGHASISTTQIYTALDFQRLALVYDAAHPRARRRDKGRTDDR